MHQELRRASSFSRLLEAHLDTTLAATVDLLKASWKNGLVLFIGASWLHVTFLHCLSCCGIPEHHDCGAGGALPDGQDLAGVRAWLAAARRLSPQLGDALVAQVEAEFVAARAADPALGQEHLHTWLLVRGCHPLPYPCSHATGAQRMWTASGWQGAPGASAAGPEMHALTSVHAHMPALLGPCALEALVLTSVLRGCPRAQLARLLAASWGEAEVTAQRWAEMRALERARAERTGIHVTAVIAG